jgi:hypothetical protein
MQQTRYITPMETETMVEVFKTNVEGHAAADTLICLLQQYFPCHRINFDLEDCDRILRIEGDDLIVSRIVHLVNKQGFSCHVLE